MQELPRHDEARRPRRAAQPMPPAGVFVFNAEAEHGAGAAPASHFSHRSLSIQHCVVASQAALTPAQRVVGVASGTLKVIDPDGAKVYKFWEDVGGSEEVAHLAQGTSVEVTATRGNQVRIVAPKVGCVFRASLEPIASVPVASTLPDVEEHAEPGPDNDDDDSELEQGASSSGVTARVLARRRGRVETPAAPAPDVEAPAAPPPEDDDAVMAEAVETQDQANQRRRDEITANLDRLAINSPDTYTTLVGSLVRLTRDLLGMENPTTSVWL